MAGEIGDYCGIDFIGGGLGAVDKIDGAVLQDKDHFLVVTPTVFAPLSLDADSGAGENSPQIIAPNTNPGDKRWILAKGVFAGLDLYGDVVLSAGVTRTIGHAAGPLLTFNDTDDQLEITGWEVGIGDFVTYPIRRALLHIVKLDNSGIAWPTWLQNTYGASDMGGTGVGLKLKTYTGHASHLDKWAGIAAESRSTPSYGKRVDLVFYTVENADNNPPTEKARITGPGYFGVGTINPGQAIDARSTPTVLGDARINQFLFDNTAMAAGVGGGLAFAGNYTAAGAQTTFAGIWGEKENANEADFAGQLHLGTRVAAGSVLSDLVIDSLGNVTINGILNVTETYKVDGTQVVSNQGAAVANATDPATTMARLNDLLARCRAHGLIAT